MQGRRWAAPPLHHQFDSYEQQRDTASLGMWIFIGSEVMFFGGLFTMYIVYRLIYPTAFAVAGQRNDVVLGTLMTCILLTSSLSMAIAVHFAQLGRSRLAAVLLLVTIALGVAFLAIKFHEYHQHYVEHLVPGPGFRLESARGLPPDPPAIRAIAAPDSHAAAPFGSGNIGAEGGALTAPAPVVAAQLFFALYFGMTGLHALHMIVGLALLSGLVVAGFRGKFTPLNHDFIEGTGLYWHFVDVVWVFLYPLFYLVDRHVSSS